MFGWYQEGDYFHKHIPVLGTSDGAWDFWEPCSAWHLETVWQANTFKFDSNW